MQFVQSPYKGSRGGKKIDLVVIHTMVGTYKGTISYFQKNDLQVSAHYCVDLNGDITQMVQEKEYASHAGVVDKPTSSIVRSRVGVNPNLYSIGIENADNLKPADADRSGQYPALIKLVYEICKLNDIPMNREHIIGHREIRASKTCPGNLDVDYIVREVQKLQGGGTDMDENEKKFLTKFQFADLAEAERVVEEHMGTTRGNPDLPGGGYLASERKLAKKWRQTAEKYVPDQSAEDAVFEDVQKVIAAYQGQVTALENQMKELRVSVAIKESEIANREEQVSRKEAQVLEQEKAKNAEISNLSKTLKDTTALYTQAKGTISSKQDELDKVYKEKGRLTNDLAACQAGQPVPKKSSVFTIIAEWLKELFGKKG